MNMNSKYGSIVFFIILANMSFRTHAQTLSSKPALDTNSFSHWRRVDNPFLSNDGQYKLYTETGGTSPDAYALVIVSNNSGWKTKIEGIDGHTPYFFSNDSRYVFFLKPLDSLGILDLHTKSISYINGVGGFTVPKNGNWAVYQTKEKGPSLTLLNTQSGKTLTYPGVTYYDFNEQGTEIALLSEKDGMAALTEVKLPSGETKAIEKAKSISQVTFDPTGKRLAFVVTEQQNNQTINSICCYRNGLTQKLASGSLPGLEGFSVSDDRLRFSRNGDKIIFSADTLPKSQLAPGAINAISKLDVWNYKDPFPQTYQHNDPIVFGGANGTHATVYYLVVSLADRSISPLNRQGEDVRSNLDSFENYIFVASLETSRSIFLKQPRGYYLVSTTTGQRATLDANRTYNGAISPDEKYIVWFDEDSSAYISYQIATRIKRMISKQVPDFLYTNSDGYFEPIPYGMAGWSADGKAVYLYDRNDIWKVDLAGKIASVNITNGFGRKEGLIFTLFSFKNGPLVIRKNDGVFLLAFDPETKENGFYHLTLDENKMPERLSMGKYAEFTGRPGIIAGNSRGASCTNPVKARDKDVYLVTRQRADSAPNLYITTDFKQFKPVSDVHPEKNYNWLTSELIKFSLPDGKTSMGILYKPENFDPSKKYPVIFNYYTKWSDALNLYNEPDWTGANINISYFVSNGYLIFRPDIYYRQGHSGECAVEALVSAAKCLSKLSYVDSTKLGINGHSFGGFETNFIETHTNIFAAACAVSGMSDMISDYYKEKDTGTTFVELGFNGAPWGQGVTPYSRPDLYIENSPVLFANKATTPLLIVGGDLDQAVPITEDLQMYAAMNRAGKKVWLLEYNENGHIMKADNAGKDLTIRMKQFFDYYLKGATPPIWMTRGVPAATRAEDTGLEYDNSGAKP